VEQINCVVPCDLHPLVHKERAQHLAKEKSRTPLNL
jgi:hypothetical protein